MQKKHTDEIRKIEAEMEDLVKQASCHNLDNPKNLDQLFMSKIMGILLFVGDNQGKKEAMELYVNVGLNLVRMIGGNSATIKELQKAFELGWKQHRELADRLGLDKEEF